MDTENEYIKRSPSPVSLHPHAAPRFPPPPGAGFSGNPYGRDRCPGTERPWPGGQHGRGPDRRRSPAGRCPARTCHPATLRHGRAAGHRGDRRRICLPHPGCDACLRPRRSYGSRSDCGAPAPGPPRGTGWYGQVCVSTGRRRFGRRGGNDRLWRAREPKT